VPIALIGETGGGWLTLPGEARISIGELDSAFESFLPAYMSAPAEIV
jgi:hypothetical protein